MEEVVRPPKRLEGLECGNVAMKTGRRAVWAQHSDCRSVRSRGVCQRVGGQAPGVDASPRGGGSVPGAVWSRSEREGGSKVGCGFAVSGEEEEAGVRLKSMAEHAWHRIRCLLISHVMRSVSSSGFKAVTCNQQLTQLLSLPVFPSCPPFIHKHSQCSQPPLTTLP